MDKLLHGLSFNFWPSNKVNYQNGWLIRVSEGFTKRANSVFVNNYYGNDYVEDIAKVENMYQRAKLDCIFQIPRIGNYEILDDILDKRGYTLIDHTSVQLLNITTIEDFDLNQDLIIEVVDNLNQSWIKNYQLLQDLDESKLTQLKNILNLIEFPDTYYFTLKLNENVIGQAILIHFQGHYLVVNVIIDKKMRGKGFGEYLMNELLDFIQKQNGQFVFLQVLNKNIVAKRLYEKLGFKEVYSYHYRKKIQ